MAIRELLSLLYKRLKRVFRLTKMKLFKMAVTSSVHGMNCTESAAQ